MSDYWPDPYRAAWERLENRHTQVQEQEAGTSPESLVTWRAVIVFFKKGICMSSASSPPPSPPHVLRVSLSPSGPPCPACVPPA